MTRKNPDNYCPICGVYVKDVGYINHRCRKNVLVAIDATNTRISNDDHNPRFPCPGLVERLKSGFALSQQRDPWSKSEEIIQNDRTK